MENISLYRNHTKYEFPDTMELQLGDFIPQQSAVIIVDMLHQKEYIVVSLKTSCLDNMCFVVDRAYLQNKNWSVNNDGYAGASFHGERKHMHQQVFGARFGDYMLHQAPTMSIDHINNIKADNRLCNLRLATKQQQSLNRNSYSPESEIPWDLHEKYGITNLPRGLRYDKTEDKFTFSDHILAKTFSGQSTGTKSIKPTHLEKLVDSLKNYIQMMEESTEDLRRPLAAVRLQLSLEFIQIIGVATCFNPIMFPKPEIDPVEEDDETIARKLMSQIGHLVTSEILHGPKELARIDALTGNPQISVRTKGDCTVVYDTKHGLSLSDVNWDSQDLRIHIHKGLTVRWPSLATKHPSAKKIHLMYFVYTILENKDVPVGHCLIPYNTMQCDVRIENIQTVPGDYRNNKPSSRILPDGICIGLKYLPKNVVMTTDSCYPDNEVKYVFAVMTEGKVKKFTTRARDAQAIFNKSVAPLLAMDWKDRHEELTRLLESFYNAVSNRTMSRDGE